MNDVDILNFINQVYKKTSLVPLHPLKNIVVVFDPYMPKNIIFELKGIKYCNKKILHVPETLRDVWEEMERKEGFRSERWEPDLKFSYNPLRLEKMCKHKNVKCKYARNVITYGCTELGELPGRHEYTYCHNDDINRDITKCKR